MKKTIFLIASAFLSISTNAQIELIKTFDAYCNFGYNQSNYKLDKFVSVSDRRDSVTLYNEDFSVFRQLQFDGRVESVTQNLCSTSGKIEFLVCKQISNHPNSKSEVKIYDEDGSLIKDLGTFNMIESSFMFISIEEGKNMLVFYDFISSEAENNNTGKTIYKTYIYSVPGNGNPSTGLYETSTQSPMAVRKAIRNGNVFVDTPEHIYTISGQVME